MATDRELTIRRAIITAVGKQFNILAQGQNAAVDFDTLRNLAIN